MLMFRYLLYLFVSVGIATVQADDAVAIVGHAGQIAPRVRRVAAVHADRIAVDAADRFVRAGLVLRPAVVAQHQLVGGQRDRFRHGGRIDPFRQSSGSGAALSMRCDQASSTCVGTVTGWPP